MKKYVYGLDLSLKTTGIAIFDEKGNVEKVCSVSPNEKGTHGMRLKGIADTIL